MSSIHLPAVNALLNAVAAALLACGWVAIKRRKNEAVHKRFMVLALAASALFLATYTFYHYTHGSTRYQGQGILRGVYFFVLATHIPLAALVVPFSLVAVWHAFRGHFEKHVRITRWLWPVWMYVSVTGVLIYVLLYVL